ncbi:MAG TPA: hypothetical protein VFQ68_03560 [Streptosporangiaceae bacterium]|nr:hypothetical protein [Streptosporangiaceae bacterium]
MDAAVDGGRTLSPGRHRHRGIGQIPLVQERAQAVVAVEAGLVAPDGVTQRGQRGVGPCRRGPVAQDTSEEVGLADGLGAVEAVGGSVGEFREFFEGFGWVVELAERARAAVVGGVVEAGQPEAGRRYCLSLIITTPMVEKSYVIVVMITIIML